jgi:long-chain acyl-CoA synthetase
MPVDTIVSRLFHQADTRPDAPALHTKQRGAWRAISYRSYAHTVREFARALLALDFVTGDTVSILGFNRPEWAYAAVGAMAAGGAAAGIYTTSSASEIKYIAGHAESKVLVVEDAALLERVLSIADELPALVKIVTMLPCDSRDPRVVGFDAFLATGATVDAERLDQRVASLEPTGLASLIYTSGTTGPPKAVMLSHDNVAFTATLAQELAGASASDCSLSYLPLSHIAEQMFTIHGSISMGSSVYFAESLEKVPDNLKEVQPTLFFGVPRIWEKFHAKVSGGIANAKGPKRRLVDWARRVGLRVSQLRMKGREPVGLLALEYKAAKRLVFDKLKPAMGLGRARFCVSGAAPIAKEVLEFFASLDVIVLEVYGQSEDCGPTSCNLHGRTKLGTVGPPASGVTVKIADDGEILVKGRNVFLGYMKDPDATSEVLVDGWLHSGDLGALDEDGFLTITGRKKDIIITAGGKNIAPKNLEAELKNHPLVSEAVVIGDRRKYLSALITLDPEALEEFGRTHGLGPAELHQHPRVRESIQAAVDQLNKDLARVETVKRFTILGRPLSIESGELTPTLKVKRKVVSEHFASEIEAMYAD